MILIENGTLVSPRESFLGDILVEGEKIKKIFRKDSPNFQAEKDAALAFENAVERIELRLYLNPCFLAIALQILSNPN